MRRHRHRRGIDPRHGGARRHDGHRRRKRRERQHRQQCLSSRAGSQIHDHRGGTSVDFTKDGKGGYTATVPKVKGEFKDQVIVSGTDKSQITLTAGQKPTDGKISGPVVYTSAADSAPKFTLTVTDYEIVEDQAAQWNATVEGETYPLDVNGDTASKDLPEVASYPGDITVTDGTTTITLTPGYQNVTVESGDKLGQLNVSGTANYHQDADATKNTPAFNVTLPFAYTSGNPVTVDGTETELTKSDDGKYHAVTPVRHWTNPTSPARTR